MTGFRDSIHVFRIAEIIRPYMVYSRGSQTRSWSLPNTAHFACLLCLTHPFQVLKLLLMSWWVESGVIEKKGDMQNVQCWGGSRNEFGNPWFIVFKSSNLFTIYICKTDCRAFSTILTPCWSSFSSCSGTLGELVASLRHWMLTSGTTYSRTSLRGSPREVPCLAVEGTASSRIEPLKVVSWRWTEWRERSLAKKKERVHNVGWTEQMYLLN